MLSRRLVLTLIVTLALAAPSMAYNIVDASWTVNCLFSTSCSLPAMDYNASILGNGKLQSRAHHGESGSPEEGKWLYEYRVDLKNAVGVTHIPYVDQVAIANVGPILSLDYNYDSVATDQVFNITYGGLGTKPVTSSYVYWGWTYFLIASRVYAGSYAGGGESSYFFGFTSDYAPVVRSVSVHTDTGWVNVNVYAP